MTTSSVFSLHLFFQMQSKLGCMLYKGVHYMWEISCMVFLMLLQTEVILGQILESRLFKDEIEGHVFVPVR